MQMQKILLVEDDQETSRVYTESLSEHFEVQVARTAAEALTAAVEYQPALILLDIMLPGGKNGFDFLRDLKNHKDIAHIPVIVLTNLDDQSQTALEAGAQACFVKANVDFPEILSAIQTAIADK